MTNIKSTQIPEKDILAICNISGPMHPRVAERFLDINYVRFLNQNLGVLVIKKKGKEAFIEHIYKKTKDKKIKAYYKDHKINFVEK